MLEANVQGWKAKYIALGEANGEAKGEAKGRAEGARESLLKILNFRFGQLPDNLISTISNMSDYNLLSKLQNSALTPEYSLQEFMEFLPRDIAKC